MLRKQRWSSTSSSTTQEVCAPLSLHQEQQQQQQHTRARTHRVRWCGHARACPSFLSLSISLVGSVSTCPYTPGCSESHVRTFGISPLHFVILSLILHLILRPKNSVHVSPIFGKQRCTPLKDASFLGKAQLLAQMVTKCRRVCVRWLCKSSNGAPMLPSFSAVQPVHTQHGAFLPYQVRHYIYLRISHFCIRVLL